jgi:hypothetical protein
MAASMQNDEAIARSLQYQEQDAASERRAQEARDAALAASLAEPAGSGAARISQEASDARLAASLAQPAGSGAAIPRAVAAPLPASAPYAANLRCREGCALTPFSASPHQRVQCDRCGNRISAGRQTLSCLAHDYDVCETCAAAPPAPQIVQGRVLPSPPQGVVQGTIVHRASGRGIVGERAVAGPTGVNGGMVLVDCRFGDAASVEMMVDSGAQHSVISAPLARRLGLMNRLDRSEQGVAAGVGRARIIGKLRSVAIYLKNVEFALDFSVLEIQDQLLLLGLDQLRRFRCIIDLEQNVLVFGGAGGVQVPFLAQERVRRYIQRTPLDGCRQM